MKYTYDDFCTKLAQEIGDYLENLVNLGKFPCDQFEEKLDEADFWVEASTIIMKFPDETTIGITPGHDNEEE